MPKPINSRKPKMIPKKPIQAKRVPRKRGLRQSDLKRLQALQSKDLGEEKALERLWEVKYKPRFDNLVDSLPSEFFYIRRRLVSPVHKEVVFKQLIRDREKIGLKKFNEIIELLLKHPDFWVRANAVWAFASLGNIGFLERALSNPDAMVRADAVQSLGSLGSVSSVPLLKKLALSDPDIMIRRNAALVLKNLGKKSRGGKK